MNTELTLESLYEMFIERLGKRQIWATHWHHEMEGYNDFHLWQPRTSIRLRVADEYDVEQRYDVTITRTYTIQKYDKPRFKKDTRVGIRRK